MKFEHANLSLSGESNGRGFDSISAADELLIGDLVESAVDAEWFEAVALGREIAQDGAYKFPVGQAGQMVAAAGSLRPWLRVGSIAAAAAIAVTTFVMLRSPVTPTVNPIASHGTGVTTGEVAKNSNNTTSEAPSNVRVVSHGGGTASKPVEQCEAPRIEVAKVTTYAASNSSVSEVLEGYAHLDPAILNGGVPTLTGDRSLVMAVYRGDQSDCDCFKWTVKEVGDSAAAPEELASALETPCAAGSRAVTVVSITGPRDLLPFHDADAKELVQCIAQVAAETEIDADDLREATLAALCLPDELSVETKSVTLASR